MNKLCVFLILIVSWTSSCSVFLDPAPDLLAERVLWQLKKKRIRSNVRCGFGISPYERNQRKIH